MSRFLAGLRLSYFELEPGLLTGPKATFLGKFLLRSQLEIGKMDLAVSNHPLSVVLFRGLAAY